MNNIEITNKECDWKDENGYVTAVPNHTYIKLRLVKNNAAKNVRKTLRQRWMVTVSYSCHSMIFRQSQDSFRKTGTLY